MRHPGGRNAAGERRSRFLLSYPSCPIPLPPTSPKFPFPRPGPQRRGASPTYQNGTTGRDCRGSGMLGSREARRKKAENLLLFYGSFLELFRIFDAAPEGLGCRCVRRGGELADIRPKRPHVAPLHINRHHSLRVAWNLPFPILSRLAPAVLVWFLPPRSAATGSSLRPALPLSYRVENPESSPCTPTPSSSTASANATA